MFGRAIGSSNSRPKAAREESVSSGMECCNAVASHPCARIHTRSVGLNARIVPQLLRTLQRRFDPMPLFEREAATIDELLPIFPENIRRQMLEATG
jgi:hypothetical protein